jgi:hypothetical protein
LEISNKLEELINEGQINPGLIKWLNMKD